MHKHIADELTMNLRSGEFEQGRNRLRSVEGKFCCLGVLCEMAVKAGVIPPATLFRKYTDAYTYGASFDDSSMSVLPDAVRDWAGMNSSTGEFGIDGETLTVLNDRGESFNDIADRIDKDFELL
jgi:hypothetical protein